MKEPLADKGITLKYSKQALAASAETSHGKKFGARDIRKAIRTDIEDKIAEIIINSAENPVAVINIGEKKGEIEIESL